MKNLVKIVLGSVVVVALLVVLLVGKRRHEGGPDGAVAGDDLLVYCGAGLQPALEAVAKRYGEECRGALRIQYGGSGMLLSNIEVSKTGDLFVAGDTGYLETGRKRKLVREIVPLARMHPVIAVRRGNPREIRTLDDLLREGMRVGLGNPDATAIGKLVKQRCEAEERWGALENAVRRSGVFKPTVGDVATDVRIGSVDAGIVWDATVRQMPELEAVPIDAWTGAGDLIAVGVLTSSRTPSAALRFARYLGACDRGLQAFAEQGYEPVRGDRWVERPEIVLFSGGVNRVAIETTLKEFQQREGVDVVTSYNGCGILVGQMRAGQRPDAYFACDTSYMVQVDDLFEQKRPVSETSMVLLVEKGNPRGIRGLETLVAGGVKIAMCNPQHSALGALTRRLLTSVGLWDKLQPNIAFSDAPTADMVVARVELGRENVGIVYRANTIRVADKLDVVPIDHPQAHAVQPIAAARATEHPQLVSRLIDALEGDASRKRFEQNGFQWRVGMPLEPAASLIP